MKRILITGGCGFIGCNLVRTLLSNKTTSVRVIDSFVVGKHSDLSTVLDFKVEVTDFISDLDWNLNIQVIQGDILDSDSLLKISEGADAVVHLAANTGVAPSVSDPMFDCKTNVIGTLNTLEACRINNIKRFVFASSGAPLGEQIPPLSENSLPQPASPYGASKLAGEGYCSAYSKSFGIETIGLRFGNVYGPGSLHKSSVIAKFIKLALSGEKIEIYGDGTQTRDFIHVSDLISAIKLALSVPNISGEIFQIATASETSINTLISSIKTVFQKNNLLFPDVTHSEERVGDVKRNFSDTSKARSMLGWTPAIQLMTGIEETLKYFSEGESVHE